MFLFNFFYSNAEVLLIELPLWQKWYYVLYRIKGFNFFILDSFKRNSSGVPIERMFDGMLNWQMHANNF